MTRGKRNNNPLNIRRSTDRWFGMSDEQPDKEFVTFKALEYGLRAAIKIIRRYITHYRCDSIRKIVSRWAPSSENDTESYINYVATWVRISPDQSIDARDKLIISNIIQAMSVFESQWEIPIVTIYNVWQLYFTEEDL